ncbi:MAG TPA: filamentous hemagglutinin N-terminal domain-containing protein [Geminicoccus sp.]|jgi:filamentous hemagglutinin family protein|uniref:two-partner secretion domain-containing protein n=1 Tax=Geminicoccus sp. TaxID=2024832 RepID=UPI002E335961|nr:filamentous hemagglutinin N-terminal domain-containing protein [Geminicoccus sp.]HEX2528262.1 filamentous hemagglutinin N-terminal domain-containing protein [Geminicoccus sp.]
MRICTSRLPTLACLLATTCLSPANAQVGTDGTLGPKRNLAGPNIEVPAHLGQIRGQNLFHSFERFGVQTNGKVTFTGPGGLNNVISRVTGGEASNIDGTLASTVPNANVYLVNPSGVVFGPNARLDVPGSFHASTADELRFEDGAVFSALDPSGSRLTVAAPKAFGFLGSRMSRITVDRSVLQAKEGQNLSLTSENIDVSGNGIRFDDEGNIGSTAGKVLLAAPGGVAEIEASSGKIQGNASGSIRMRDEAVIVSTGSGGLIRIQGGTLDIERGSTILVDPRTTLSKDVPASIDVLVDNLNLLSGSSISVDQPIRRKVSGDNVVTGNIPRVV